MLKLSGKQAISDASSVQIDAWAKAIVFLVSHVREKKKSISSGAKTGPHVLALIKRWPSNSEAPEPGRGHLEKSCKRPLAVPPKQDLPSKEPRTSTGSSASSSYARAPSAADIQALIGYRPESETSAHLKLNRLSPPMGMSK